MPCNGGNYFGGQIRVVNDPKDRKTIDDLTRKLCHACQLLEDAGAPIPAELNEWWYEHKLEDQERIKEAKRRAAAQSAEQRRATYLASVKERMLTQMTDDEKEALGIK